MSLDGALVCAKNEDQSIPIDIQTEFIYLIRGKYLYVHSSVKYTPYICFRPGLLKCKCLDFEVCGIKVLLFFLYVVMLDDSTKLKTTLHTLEPLTWCCVQVCKLFTYVTP